MILHCLCVSNILLPGTITGNQTADSAMTLAIELHFIISQFLENQVLVTVHTLTIVNKRTWSLGGIYRINKNGKNVVPCIE